MIVVALLLASRVSAAQSVPSSESAGDAPAEEKRPRIVSPSHRTSLTGDRVALLAHLGFGPPGGVIGVDADIAPIRNLAVNFGAGYSPGGGQVAITPRLRLGLSPRVFLGLGTGLSLGRYIDGGGSGCLFCEPMAQRTWQAAYWHNVEVALDWYPRRGRSVAQFVIGAGHILNSRDYSCDLPRQDEFSSGSGCDRGTDGWLGFASVAFGFDL